MLTESRQMDHFLSHKPKLHTLRYLAPRLVGFGEFVRNWFDQQSKDMTMTVPLLQKLPSDLALNHSERYGVHSL